MNTGQMDPSWIRALEILLAFLSPIILAFIASRQEKERERAKKESELETEQREKAAEAQKQQSEMLCGMITDLHDEVSQVRSDVDDMHATVRSMQDTDREIRQDISTLRMAQERSTAQSHELSKLVIVLGEGLRDQHLDGTLTEAVADYRAYEREQLHDLMHIKLHQDVGLKK